MNSDPIPAICISAFTCTSSIGLGIDATQQALLQGRSGLRPCDFETVNIPTFIGRVPEIEATALPESLLRFDCRNNRLAYLALHQDGFNQAVARAAQRYGAGRIGVFLGTSTSGMLQTELAYRELGAELGGKQAAASSSSLPAWLHYAETQNTYSVADFVRHYFALTGPAAVVSTACSSSAKVVAMAQRMLQLGLIDAAVVGGVDSLCLTTLYGFQSMQLLSPHACQPFGAQRSGISIGEAGAFMLLERSGESAALYSILGVGESSDAHHMSSPHPEGLGAQRAMQAALEQAGLKPNMVDYINLHGTATPSNDRAEGHAVHSLFGAETACSSTKGFSGHCLGAAGALELVFCLLSIKNQTLWAGKHTKRVDETIPSIDYVLHNTPRALRYVLSNSFGFGGSNCSVALGVAN